MPNKIIFMCVLLAAGFGAARAEDGAAEPSFKLSGFGTLGAAHSSEKRADYTVDTTVPKGAGLSNAWSWGNDTRLGVNAQVEFSPQVTGTLQVISEYQAAGNYQPTVDWLNIKYALTPDAYVRVGRIALPTFLNSDTRGVGYSYPWVRPPVELYRQLIITNSDGVDVMKRFEMGDATNSIRAIAGKTKVDRATGVTNSKDIWGLFDTVDYDAVTFRIGYQEREASSYSNLTGVTGAWTRNRDLTLGAAYDPGKWFVMSEWIQRQSMTKRSAMYASTGYRISKFTPYVIYAQDSASTILPNASGLTATAIQNTRNAQHTTSFGLRYDFAKNMDFNLQYDIVRLSANSNGDLANVPTGVVLYGEQFHVISMVVDFLF